MKPFTGIFDGGGHKITLGMGGGNNPLNMNNINNHNNHHGRLALFSYIGKKDVETTIKNVTVDGSITARLKGGSGATYLISAAGVAAYQEGAVTYENVTSEVAITIENTSADVGDAAAAGFVGQCAVGSTVNLKGCTTSAKINSNGKNAHCGLVGGSWLETTVNFEPLDVDGATKPGITVRGAELYAGSNFGGLVSRATGYWDATADNSILFTGNNTISGTSNDGATRGLLVGDGLGANNAKALYLEVGTWGSRGTAYCVEDAVTLGGGNSTYFDELVGMTIRDKVGGTNAIVSLQTDGEKFDQGTTCDTYKNQVTRYTLQNKNARYYYNLNVFRKKKDNERSPAEKLVLWGARQHAAEGIRGKFYNSDSINISGDLDLSGYSYYPVTPRGTVTIGTGKATTLRFDYAGLESLEGEDPANKKPSDENHQHHMMHWGLLYNCGKNLTVTNTILAGSVGKSALICNNVNGDDTKTDLSGQVKVNLNNITLAGLTVHGANAPLLINQISTAVKLTVEKLVTGEGYLEKDEDGNVTGTRYAATSLIGAVGSATAKYLHLDFSNIALDSRITDAQKSTCVENNGTKTVEYHTTKSIFTDATLLESFRYASDSYGVYNFYFTNDKVTFGVEISNNADTGCRNPGEQYWYYDEDDKIYAWDGIKDRPKSPSDAAAYYTSGYLRYVNQPEVDGFLEMDINKRPIELASGCGTYADPYKITDGNQLIYLANYLSNPSAAVVKGFKVRFNLDVLTDNAKAADVYHTNGKDGGRDVLFKWNGTAWENADKEASETWPTEADARIYLRNAYYQIVQDNITLKKQDYRGIGTLAQPFSGVIVGEGTGKTIHIAVKNDAVTDFGGLIRYSSGSVVKNLTVDYTGAKLTITNGDYPGPSNNPFFGGVVGYCMGGDTIIDNVSVNCAAGSVTLSDSNGFDRMIAAGGYVGLVGGAKNKDGYEKTGGGVVFRKMDGTTKTFGVSSGFYCNPYVGRVLDGYACSDGCTVNNTNENYQIPSLSEGKGYLKVTENNAGYNVEVKDGQGLWLLSAIVNSGAAAMDSRGTYADTDGGVVDAYQNGKARSRECTYEGIGTTSTDKNTALKDEAKWSGGISYLVSGFTTGDAQRIAGGGTDSNVAVHLTFTGDAKVSDYGSGFRGIGSSYGYTTNIKKDASADNWKKVWRRNLLVSGVTGNNRKVTLGMDQKIYRGEAQDVRSDETYVPADWVNQGAGLFVGFMSAPTCPVSDLTISGTVRLSYYNADGSATWTYGTNSQKKNGQTEKGDNNGDIDYCKVPDPCVGGFAARTIYPGSASASISFSNLNLTGLNASGGKYTGGAIGCVDKIGCNKSVSFAGDMDLGGLQVSAKGYNVCYTGGLLGWYNGNGTLTVGPEQGNPVTINAADSKIYSRMELREALCARIGLLAGNVSSGSVIVQNAKFDDVTVEGVRTANVGGLIGQCEKNVTSVTISNCTLNNLTVSGANCQKNGKTNDHAYYGIGGLMGQDSAATSLTNVQITGASKIYTKFDPNAAPTEEDLNDSTVANRKKEQADWLDANVGGLVGNLDKNDNNNKTTIENCHVTGTSSVPVRILNYTLKNNSENGKCNATGGLIGFDSQTTTIRKCTLSYVNIVSYVAVAGLVGHENTNGLNVTDTKLLGCNVAMPKGSDAPSTSRAGLLTGYTYGENKGYNILAENTNIGYFSDWSNGATTGTDDVLTLMGSMNADSVGLYLWNGNAKNYFSYDVAGKGENSGYKDSNYVGTWIGDMGKANDFKLVAVATKDCNVPITVFGVKANNQDRIKVTYADYPADQTNLADANGKLHLDTLPDSGATVKNGDNPFSLTGNGAGFIDIAKETSVLSAIYEESGNANRFGNVYRNHGLNLTGETSIYPSTFHTEEGQMSQDADPAEPDFPVLVILDNIDTAKVNERIWEWIAALTNVGGYGTTSAGDAAKAQIKSVSASTFLYENGAFVKQSVPASLKCVSNVFSLTTNGNTVVVDNGEKRFTLVDVQYANPVDTGTYHLYLPVLVRKVLPVNATVKLQPGTSYHPGDYLSDVRYVTAGYNEPLTAYIQYQYLRSYNEWNTMNDAGAYNYQKVVNLVGSEKATMPSGTKLILVDAQTDKFYTYTLQNGDNRRQFNLSKMTDGMNGTPFSPQPISTLLAGKTGPDYPTEAYYLTILIPETGNKVDGYKMECVANDQNEYQTMVSSGGKAPSASLRDPVGHNYVLYEGVQQIDTEMNTKWLKVDSDDTHKYNDVQTVVNAGESIYIKLSTKLTLDSQVRESFATLPPATVHHQFNVSLKELTQDQKVNAMMLDAAKISWKYEIYPVRSDGVISEPSVYSGSETKESVNQEVLTIGYGGGQMVDWLKQSDLLVTAEIEITYGDIVNLPVRGSDDGTGAFVHYDSRLSNEADRLPVTASKVWGEGSKYYHTTRPASAKLVFEAAGDTYGTDHTRQLGINPLDPEAENPELRIIAFGTYEFLPATEENWDEKDLQIEYTFVLQQKQENGEYSPVSAPMSNYLKNTMVEVGTVREGNSFKVTAPFNGKDLRSTVGITFNPVTGTELEGIDGYAYANYKLQVTAKLFEGSKEVAFSQASDYIIYTNAKIQAKPLMEDL